MNSHHQVIPECYADTLLVEVLGFTRPNHQLGIGIVFNEIHKNFKRRQAVGIIDDDKRKPKDLDLFNFVEEHAGVKKLRSSDLPNTTILIISPAFEDWVFENARVVDVDPGKYGFRSSKDLQKACKRIDVNKDEQVKQLLNTLKQKKAPGFERLQTWITEAIGEAF
ncbi:MAG: hypothetical protein HUU01_03995 [Saprospiraceae bacterium]|nr:hypothetical protein [Saprospiraceae bacterium]